MTNTERTEAGSPFEALPQQRVFQQIIGQIEEAILAGRLKQGDRLPSERELAQTFGVSRASVREALRVLEMFGVVIARRGTGPDAGSIVTASAQTGLASALGLSAALLPIPTRDLVELRAVLESHAAKRAALTVGPSGTAELRRLVERMREAVSVDAYHREDTEFHVELARASGNALAPVLMEALRGAMRRDMLRGFAALDDWEAERDLLVAEHSKIIDHIDRGESEEAEAAVRDHILHFYQRAMDDAE